MPTPDLSIDKIPEDYPVAASCVVPEAKKKLFDRDIFWISPTLKTGLNLTLLDTSTLGADRLANAVALATHYSLPAICVDCGTAITLDVVDADKRYYGGVISPGRNLLRKALNLHTAQLPDVPLLDTLKNVIGTNTIDAILSGTDRGAVCLLSGLIENAKYELSMPDINVIATGGDARFFVDHIDKMEFGGDDMTLQGVVEIWKLNHPDHDES